MHGDAPVEGAVQREAKDPMQAFMAPLDRITMPT